MNACLTALRVPAALGIGGCLALLSQWAVAADLKHDPAFFPRPAPAVLQPPSAPLVPLRLEYLNGDRSLPTLIARASSQPGQEHQLRFEYEKAGDRWRVLSLTESGYTRGERVQRSIRLHYDGKGKVQFVDGPLPGSKDSFKLEWPAEGMNPARDEVSWPRVWNALPQLTPTDSYRQWMWMLLAWVDRYGQVRAPAAEAVAAGAQTTPSASAQGPLHAASPHLATPTSPVPRPQDVRVRWFYDDLNRLISWTSVDVGTFHGFYDEADRMVLGSMSSGIRMSTSWDAFDRPLERVVTAPKGFEERTTWHYRGKQLREVRSPNSTESYRYDWEGRMTERVTTVHPVGSAGRTQRFVTRFEYPKEKTDQRPVAVELPNGARLRWHRGGQWQAVHADNFRIGPGKEDLLTKLSQRFMPKERRGDTSWLQENGDGLVTAFNLDGGMQPRAFATVLPAAGQSERQALSQQTFQYRPDGRLETFVTSRHREAFAYDSAGRLIIAEWHPRPATGEGEASGLPEGVVGMSGPLRMDWWYAYDELGNRIFSKRDQRFAAERSASFVPGTNRYANLPYTATGLPLRWEEWSLKWDPLERLERVKHRDGREIRYFYNHRGERIARQQGSDWRFYAYRDGQIFAEVGTSRPVMRVWWYEGGIPVLLIDERDEATARRLAEEWSAQTPKEIEECVCNRSARYRVRWIHTDQRGMPYALLDRERNLSWSLWTGPFGEQLRDTRQALQRQVSRSAAGSEANWHHEDPLNRFPGQWVDHETGLYFSRRGDYDPESGRYLVPQVDVGPTDNPYLFMAGNPMQGTVRFLMAQPSLDD